MISLTEDKAMLGYELYDLYPNIACFVTTRMGGFSKDDAYSTFNCSPFSGDDEVAVQRNQLKLCNSLAQQPEVLIIPHQVHGTVVRCLKSDFMDLDANSRQLLLEGVDALITNVEGHCICVSTADCVPIVLYDRKKAAVGVVHAGWRGTVAGILAETLHQMNVSFGTQGEDVLACIGPSISCTSFEVGQEVYDAFFRQGYPMERISFFNEKTGKHHLDLWEANRMALIDFGVPDVQIQLAGICTFARHEEFFSARRLGILSGRILSGIMLNKTLK